MQLDVSDKIVCKIVMPEGNPTVSALIRKEPDTSLTALPPWIWLKEKELEITPNSHDAVAEYVVQLTFTDAALKNTTVQFQLSIKTTNNPYFETSLKNFNFILGQKLTYTIPTLLNAGEHTLEVISDLASFITYNNLTKTFTFDPSIDLQN